MLDPTSAFATAIQLLAIFKNEREESRQRTIEEYLEWLRRHRHEQLTDILQANSELICALDHFMRGETNEIKETLSRIETVIVAVAGKQPTLQAAVAAVTPQKQLSDQAIEILKVLEEERASGFVTIRTRRDTTLAIRGNSSRADYEPSEPRYLEDDLEMLCTLGLIRLDNVNEHSESYHVTRAAGEIVKSLRTPE